MKKIKKQNYLLTAGIDTANGEIYYNAESSTDKISIMHTSTMKNNKSSIKFSLNRGNKNIIDKYSNYETKLQNLLNNKTTIRNFTYKRIDVALDSPDPEFFEEYCKLHRFMCALLSVTYENSNTYITKDLLTSKNLSICIKNKTIELENYDKKSESKGKSSAASRLELRKKKLSEKYTVNNKINYSLIIKDWKNILNDALSNFDKTLNYYNDLLLQIYKNLDKKFKKLHNFIPYFRDYFFSRKQLRNFLNKINAKDIEGKIKYYKQNYNIEFFSKSDIKYANNTIIKALKTFFKN